MCIRDSTMSFGVCRTASARSSWITRTALDTSPFRSKVLTTGLRQLSGPLLCRTAPWIVHSCAWILLVEHSDVHTNECIWVCLELCPGLAVPAARDLSEPQQKCALADGVRHTQRREPCSVRSQGCCSAWGRSHGVGGGCQLQFPSHTSS